MGDGFFDRNLRRLLARAAKPVEADPTFRQGLRRRLLDEAARMRGPASPAGPGGAPAFAAPPRGSGPWRLAAAAVVTIALAGVAIWVWRVGSGEPWGCGAGRAPSVEPLRLSADSAVVMAVSPGATGAVSLERSGAELVRLELKDGAEVGLEPDRVPVLALREGLVRVQSRREVRVRAAPVELAVGSGADLEVERIDQRGETSMSRSWLIPGGLVVAAGATVVAVLVHQGRVDVKSPETRPTLVPAEKAMVIETPATKPVVPDDRDQKLAQAQWRIAELEKKLAAAKKDADKFASELVQKKGVTIENLTSRIADLKKKPQLTVMLPGETAGIIADLKGLGQAGTQAVLEMLKSDDPKERFIAAKLLEDLKDPAAIASLRDVALNDPDKMASNMAGHAIALMGDPQALDTLREIAAKNRTWESEVNSLWGLVNLGDSQGRDMALAYMQNEQNPETGRGALGANIAVFMHTPDVMPIVDRTVQDFYKSEQVMGIAVEYYAALGTPDARSRLQGIADDTRLSQAIRNAARDALAR